MVNKETLENGVRIITETVPYVQSVSIGFWVNSGSRDEDDTNRGISHFIEHMLFKGTEKRTASQIADEFDSIGGQLNAFTDKEYTCFFAKILSDHVDVAVEVLSDMMLNSLLELSEIELEKNVVLEEIKRHEDNPEELVHDIFAGEVWGSHPLGLPVLGKKECISAITRESIVDYMRTRYTPDSMVITAAGNLSHDQLVEKVKDIFGELEGAKVSPIHSLPVFAKESKLIQKNTEQVHFCVGTRGYSNLDSEKYTLAVIDTVLGGSMSSRLFQEIREKRGLVYAIGSYSLSYRESGLFNVFGGTSIELIDQVLELILAEFGSVRDNNITENELKRAKNQIHGALVLGQENMSNRMIRIAKSELYYGRIVPIEEIISLVMNVSHDNIADVSQKMFGDNEFPVIAVGPFKKERFE